MCIRDRSGGGAIYSNGFGDDASIAKNYLIIDRCVFRDNISRGESGALGGAIELISSARIANSLFDGNKVSVVNEGGYIGGGAIYADAPHTTDGGLGLTFNTEIEIINNTIINAIYFPARNIIHIQINVTCVVLIDINFDRCSTIKWIRVI